MRPLARRSLRTLLKEARLRSHSSSYLARRTGDVWLYLLIFLAVCSLCFGPLLFAILVTTYVYGKWNEALIDIHGEGIRIREGGRSTYFFRYLDITQVEGYGSSVEIQFRNQPPRCYRFGMNVAVENPRFGWQMAEQLTNELNQLCEDARREASVREIPWLNPGGKNPRAWLASLRQIGASERGEGDPFRAPRISREALWRVLESVAVAPSQRFAACVALIDHLTSEETERLRFAIENCTDKRLADDLRALSPTRDDAEIEARLARRHEASEREVIFP